MKKKYAAFLREEHSLRELAMTDAGKPAVDPAVFAQWQSKLNLLAMETDQTVALILQVQPGSVSTLLKSEHPAQVNMDPLMASGLYLITDSGTRGLLITNNGEGGSQAGAASLTTCFGLPVQWPDEALFGVICVLHYPGKKLKPVYANILSDLRDAIEDDLAEQLDAFLLPKPEPAPAVAAAEPKLDTPEKTAAAKPEVIPATVPAAVQPEAVVEVPTPAPVAPPMQAMPQPQVLPPQNPEADALTAIYSRKKIEDILKHEFERAKRYFKTFSVTMIDLNNFQKINSSFGQEAGDEVLKAFAKSIGSKIRETDSWGRWGGDEFILVCPYADTVETQQMFARIKPLVSRDMKAFEGYSDYSLGVSQYEPDDLTFKTMIVRAEENMHQYKEMMKRKAIAEAADRNASGR
ncbi:MAG TPA: GGDEF domain-containing protein [Candidatus Limiplasma sp.]|nr:GGDEF domain-containing protein [Candidatus Limiplasma sp.]HRX08569.1 GGDEF domain-containing protein [Candidatus Limiplasma sp.]